MQFKEPKPWPRRTFFIFMMLVSVFTYNRVFSVILITLAFLMFEVLFTRMDNNRKIIKEFFEGFKRDK